MLLLSVLLWSLDAFYYQPLSFLVHGSSTKARGKLDVTMISRQAYRPAAASQLLELLKSEDLGRGGKVTPSQRKVIFELVKSLTENPSEQKSASRSSYETKLLTGSWRLIFQGIDGPEVSATSLQSWQDYFSGNGPSPLQNLVTSQSSNVGNVFQILDLKAGTEGSLLAGSFDNLVDFSPAGCLELKAQLEGEVQPSRLAFRFKRGEIRLRFIWNSTLTLPYPVPFQLLGDKAVGWLETIYIDDDLRVSLGNKGSIFVLVREDLPSQMNQLFTTPINNNRISTKTDFDKDPIVLCPAQFGTPEDYTEFVRELESRGHPVFVAPLSKLNWFELIPSFFSKAYWTGELEPSKTLGFYYRTLDEAFSKAKTYLQNKGTNGKIHFVAHSIGGWVARAFLGEVVSARGDIGLVASLVTLGTPHSEPPEGTLFAAVDQTRGLLRNINSRFPGAFHAKEGVRYISVASAAVPGRFPISLFEKSKQAENKGWLDCTLAWASYLALCADGNAAGDGITPVSCALLEGEGVEHLELKEVDGPSCFHANYLPSPGPSIPLVGTEWYGSGEFLNQWLSKIQ